MEKTACKIGYILGNIICIDIKEEILHFFGVKLKFFCKNLCRGGHSIIFQKVLVLIKVFIEVIIYTQWPIVLDPVDSKHTNTFSVISSADCFACVSDITINSNHWIHMNILVLILTGQTI